MDGSGHTERAKRRQSGSTHTTDTVQQVRNRPVTGDQAGGGAHEKAPRARGGGA